MARYVLFFFVLVAASGNLTAQPTSPKAGPDKEMTFSISGDGTCFGCKWISATGRIGPNTDKRFMEFVRENPIITGPTLFDGSGGHLPISLNSPGGNLAAGIRLGRLFRALGLSTEVSKNDICASACVYAYLGGTKRSAEGKLAVHQFYVSNPKSVFSGSEFTAQMSEQQAVIGYLMDYLLEMGIDARLLAVASKVNPGTIKVLSGTEIIDFGLDNTKTRFAGWRLEPYNAGIVLTNAGTTPSGDKVSITLYCRASSNKVILALISRSWRGKLSADDIEYVAAEESPNKRPAAQPVKRKWRHWQAKNDGDLFVEVPVAASSIDEVIQFNTLRFTLGFSHKPFWPLGIEETFPVKGIEKHFKILGQHCI